MLEIKNLIKVYGKGKEEKIAVNDISLTVERGAFFGLLGPNGAGKSTTIHCITGVAQPTSGQILIDGIDVVKDYKLARTKVGLSPQEFNLDFFAPTEKLLDYMGGYYGIPASVRAERVEALIERFDLQEHRDVKFQKLSGGLKRRAMLGRALVHTPDLLILDEPTAGVDVEQRRTEVHARSDRRRAAHGRGLPQRCRLRRRFGLGCRVRGARWRGRRARARRWRRGCRCRGSRRRVRR